VTRHSRAGLGSSASRNATHITGSKEYSESSPGRESRVGTGKYVESPAGTSERITRVLNSGDVSHNRISLRIHCIFSTKNRDSRIPADLQDRRGAFIGGIARNIGSTAIAVGGIADHVHILLMLTPTMALSVAVQKIKANSSRWIHEQTGRPFEWQEGYAAFSVGIAQTEQTVDYILHQKEHHAKHGYGEELARIVAKHNMN